MAAVDEGQFSVRTARVSSIDHLRQPIADADVEIVQLGRGQLSGSLTKANFPTLAFSKADFSLPLRTSGMLGTRNVTICMLLGSDGHSASWGHELDRGDVFLSAPGRNFDAVFGARSEVAGISITPETIATRFAGHGALADVGYWMQNHQYSGDPHVREAIVTRVLEISTWLEHRAAMASATADFWQRTL